MTETQLTGIGTLEAEIARTLEALGKIESFYENYSAAMLSDRSDPRNAIALSEILTSYYTCLETLFFRISSFFENNLSKERWHAQLLKNMTLRINGVRERVISEGTYSSMDELRRFRHFKRYYFDFSYDWDRLDFLLKKFTELRTGLRKDMGLFSAFLEELKTRLSGE